MSLRIKFYVECPECGKTIFIDIELLMNLVIEKIKPYKIKPIECNE